jgi:hypothetical protein
MNNLQQLSSIWFQFFSLLLRLTSPSFPKFHAKPSATKSLQCNPRKSIHTWAWLPLRKGFFAVRVWFVRLIQFPLCRYHWKACSFWGRGLPALPWPCLPTPSAAPLPISTKIIILLSSSLSKDFNPISDSLLPAKTASAELTLAPFLAASQKNRIFAWESHSWQWETWPNFA